MDSCFSAKQQSSEEEGRAYEKNPSPHFAILPFSFPTFNFEHNTLFLGQHSSWNRSFPLFLEASSAARQLQKSILSNSERYLKVLDLFISRNGILHKFISVASHHLHNGCHIQRRNWQNFAMLRNSSFAAILPGDSLAGAMVADSFVNFLNTYNTLIVVRLVLTWFPNAPPSVVGPLSTICDPYLDIFRGIIPPLGGNLDLSPVLAFLLLNALTSTASAMPAELPSAEATVPRLTASRRKWTRRVSANGSRFK